MDNSIARNAVYTWILNDIDENKLPKDLSGGDIENLISVVILSDDKFWKNELDIQEFGETINVNMDTIDALREMYGPRGYDSPEPYDSYMYNLAVSALWHSDYEYTGVSRSELYSRLMKDEYLSEYIFAQANDVHLSEMEDEGLIIPITINDK